MHFNLARQTVFHKATGLCDPGPETPVMIQCINIITRTLVISLSLAHSRVPGCDSQATGPGAGYLTTLASGSSSERTLRSHLVDVFIPQKRKLRLREVKTIGPGSHGYFAAEPKLQFTFPTSKSSILSTAL